jgi:hypothetical protein
MPQGRTARWWDRDSSELSPIGQLLTDYMRDHRLSGQAELAKIIGVTQQSVSDYLKPIIKRNGEVVSKPRIPRSPILKRIAEGTRNYSPPGIPIAALNHAAGITLELDDPAPSPPLRHTAPLRLPEDTLTDRWEQFYRRLGTLKELPIAKREELIKEAHNLRFGYSNIRQYIEDDVNGPDEPK